MSEFVLPGPAAAWRPSRPAEILVGLVGAGKRREARREPGALGRITGGAAGSAWREPRQESPVCGTGALRGGSGPGVPGLLPPPAVARVGAMLSRFRKALFPPARRMRIVDDDDVSWKSRPADVGKEEEEEEGDESDLPVVSGGGGALAWPLLAGCLQMVITLTCGPSPDAKPKRSEKAGAMEWKRFNWLQDPIWLHHWHPRFCLPCAGADPQGIV